MNTTKQTSIACVRTTVAGTKCRIPASVEVETSGVSHPDRPEIGVWEPMCFSHRQQFEADLWPVGPVPVRPLTLA